MDPNEPQEPQEPQLPSAEQMRARRLAKLGQTGSSPSSAKQADSDPSSPSPTTPMPATPSQATPRLDVTAPKPRPSESVNIRTSETKAVPEAGAAAEPPQRRVHTETIQEWTHQFLSSAFRVTVDPSQTKDRMGRELTFLPELSQEMSDRGQPLRLSLEDLDPAILEAGNLWTHKKPLLDFLLPSWKNVMRSTKQLRDQRPDKVAVLQEAKRLCMSNCVFALTMPEYFGREANPEHDTLVPYLLRGIGAEDGICLDFITEAVSRFGDDEDDQISGIFTSAMLDISHKLSSMTLNDEYRPSMDVLLTYARFKPLLEALANHPAFQMAQSAPNIEKFTILGPFFRLSPLQNEVAKMYFAGPRTIEPGRVNTARGAIQMTLTSHQADLHNIAMAFARAGENPRNRLLDWFAYTMNVNHKRRAMQVNAKEVASDGFMMNITAVLDRMCEPFMEANFGRMERIDIDYLRRNPRVDIRDETKLNADQAQSDAFYVNKAGGESKFVSELFFLNMAAHHYGSGASQQKLKDLDREIKHMERQLAILEEHIRKASHSNPLAATVAKQQLQNYAQALERHMSFKLALESVLMDEKMQERSLLFMRYVSVWLLRVASQTDYTPDKALKLPLANMQPEAFSCLPEYALQNIVDNFKFVFRFVPRILPSAVGEEMIALCLAFLESSDYIRNPYLKSALVSLLYSGTWRIYHLTNGVLGDALSGTKFANQYLLHALMKFYIECESTGAHTQFYDKFNIRYEIFQVIKCVWPNDVYKRQLTQQSKTNREFFVRFVNMLLNDATYVLDEALSKFPKIHDLEKQLEEDKELTAEARQQLETELQQAEGQAQSYMQLANETVAMMKLFTDALSEAFTMPEIVSRLAGMLDYNLVTLAGPKSRNLKVGNAEKYYFNPRILLPQIIDLYLNLGSRQSFIDAVANDGRSYKPDVFDNSSRILASKGLVEPDKVAAWNSLKAKFAKAKEIADQAEQDYGEVPAEFEDPIMGDLMKDPVILPSKHIVDRSTIIQHLLSDPKDPFTRQPMTVDDVVPDDALRTRIEQWKQARVAAAQGAAADAMDTTE